jgi:hypothetical protein
MDIGEFAETGIDAVDDATAPKHRIDDFARGTDAFAGCGSEDNFQPMTRDRVNLFQGQTLAAEL